MLGFYPPCRLQKTNFTTNISISSKLLALFNSFFADDRCRNSAREDVSDSFVKQWLLVTLLLNPKTIPFAMLSRVIPL